MSKTPIKAPTHFAQLSIDTFKGVFQGGARPNIFMVQMIYPEMLSDSSKGVSHPYKPNGEPIRGKAWEHTLFVKSASLPGSTVGEISIPFRGRTFFIPGDRTFEDWTVTVINDVTFDVRNTMERWMSMMSNHTVNTGNEDIKQYKGNALVSQLNKLGQKIKTVQIHGIFPSTMDAIELSSESNDSIEEFTVTFKVDYWTADVTNTGGDKDQVDTTDAPLKANVTQQESRVSESAVKLPGQK
jgi:hypothetical protein